MNVKRTRKLINFCYGNFHCFSIEIVRENWCWVCGFNVDIANLYTSLRSFCVLDVRICNAFFIAMVMVKQSSYVYKKATP